jgi:hypothetical protein
MSGHPFLKRATSVVSGCRVVESKPLQFKTIENDQTEPPTTDQHNAIVIQKNLYGNIISSHHHHRQ